MSWNTFSSSPGYTDAQARTLIRIMRSSRGDVFALQEVSAALEALLQREAWVREFALSASREFFDEAGDGDGGGGKEGGPEAVILMVRKELVGRGSAVTYERLKVGPGERGKALVLLQLVGATGQEELRIITSHFTSLPRNAHIRRDQFSLALSRLQTSPAHSSILLGDFNNSSSEEMTLFSPFLRDAITPRTPDPFRDAPTFGALYPYIAGAPRSKPRKPRRIDMVYLGGQASGSAYEEVGREQVRDASGKRMWDRQGAEGRVWPSDHIGLVVTVKF